MKNIFIAIAFILGTAISAQEGTEKADVFVRVYDLQGKKIAKGKILSISDISLQLKGKKAMTIAADSIGSIKTKRSGGHNVLIGAASGATIFGIWMTAIADEDSFIGWSAGEGATGGVLIGGTIGAAVGGITILFKNSKTYEIKGDKLKFKEFKEAVIGLN